VNPAVQGYTAAVLDDVPPGDLPQVAAELAEVDRLLDRNAELRAVMTDVAVAGRVRRAVLEDLLRPRLGDAARRIAGYAAGAVHGQEVPAAIGWVATRARQAAEAVVAPGGAASGAATGAVLGYREARERVGGYAAAVYEDVTVRDLEEIEDELFRFTRTVAATPALRAALGNADLPVQVRLDVVHDLLTGKVRAGTLRLVDAAISGGRARDVVGTLDWLVEQTAVARGWRVARVRSGQEIDDGERHRLEETLSRLAGAPVELQVTVDPALLAGVNVEIGDLQLDATARGRLERLREHVAAGGWRDQGYGAGHRSAQPPADRTPPTPPADRTPPTPPAPTPTPPTPTPPTPPTPPAPTPPAPAAAPPTTGPAGPPEAS
jgi:F-type H+-transporting ATPase subunit delta